jgi:hypothetical protein
VKLCFLIIVGRSRGHGWADGLLLRAAAGFCNDVGYQDESYFNALVRMFERALTVTNQLPDSRRKAVVERLERTRAIAHNFGYGVGDSIDSLLAKHLRA